MQDGGSTAGPLISPPKREKVARRPPGSFGRHFRAMGHDGDVPDGDEQLYYAWLPGPWLVLRRAPVSAESGSKREGLLIEAQCERCDERLLYTAVEGDRETHERTVANARAHWEQHAQGESPVTYFPLPGVGDLKVKRTGTWTDVILTVPYFAYPGDPVPPHSLVDEILREGESSAGMSGGCEWPRQELSGADHAELRRDLAARGLGDLEAPEWVRSRDDYRNWQFSLRWRCSLAAVRAWRRKVEDLGARMADAMRRGDRAEAETIAAEQRRHLADKEGFVRAFDAS